MTELLKAILLGIVEGLTEFLPISSTGHLILLNQWITFSQEFTVVFDIFIQLGAILAVIIFFKNSTIPKGIKYDTLRNYFLFWSKVITAFLPAVFFGLMFADFIESYLFNPLTVSISLLIGGIILVIIDKKKRTETYTSINQLPYLTALYIGLFQCLAMIPGTSRSAATIIGALLLGCSRKLSAEFSFFLAIPTILAASVYSIIKSGLSFSAHDVLILLVGFISSFIIALFVIKFLMSFIQKHTFIIFGYYRIILSVVILIWLFI